MNERIRLLAKESGLVRCGDWGMERWEGPRYDSVGDQDLEKFTELIVRECTGVLSDNRFDNVRPTMNIAQAMIEQHFGVER